MEIDSSASRLHSLLLQLKQAGNANRPTYQVLAEILRVDATVSDAMHALVRLHVLLDDVIQTSRLGGKTPAAFLQKHVGILKNSLSFANLEGPWRDYRDKITGECIMFLDMLAHHDEISQSTAPSEEDIVALNEDLQNLFESVQKSKLDPDFRKFVLEQVENIRRCLVDYRISGVQGFEQYLERFLGQSVRYSKVIKAEAEANPSIIKKLKVVLGGVVKFVGATQEGIKFLGSIQETYSDGVKLLGDLSGSNSSEIPEVDSIGRESA